MRCEHCNKKKHCLVALGNIYNQGRFDAEMDILNPPREVPKNLIYDIKPPASANQRIHEALITLKKMGYATANSMQLVLWSGENQEDVNMYIDFLVDSGRIKEL